MEESTVLGINTENPNFKSMPVLSFEKTEHDFGVIKRGTQQSAVFSFTNTGKSPLVITDVKVGCGCTVPSYPKDKPMASGESGKIKVDFNGIGKGEVTKTITVIANTAKTGEVLKIKAFIEPTRR
ncbi:MAG: DUF1573 domain-containing protein [Flavobacteriaceae bacterium]